MSAASSRSTLEQGGCGLLVSPLRLKLRPDALDLLLERFDAVLESAGRQREETFANGNGLGRLRFQIIPIHDVRSPWIELRTARNMTHGRLFSCRHSGITLSPRRDRGDAHDRPTRQ